MSDHFLDDEDWYDDEDDELDDQTWPCPECGADVSSVAEMCPQCGYWLTEADQRAIGSDRSFSGRLKRSVLVLLVALLVFALIGGFMLF